MIDLDKATEFRELRVFVKPDDLHAAIDEMLLADAWDIKIEQYYEADVSLDDNFEQDRPITEFALTATFEAKAVSS